MLLRNGSRTNPVPLGFGLVVRGSKICTGNALKSPLRAASVGTEVSTEGV